MILPKFTVIHGLRGMAALWVVLFHTGKAFDISALPTPARYALFDYGSAGVAVFFVISGFVISHSLCGKDMDARELGKFAVRRSLRLDPPYWAAIVIGLVIGTLAKEHYSVGQVGLHIFYLQELTRTPEIQIVFWTLTYEIQFYLVTAFGAMICFYFPALRKAVWPALYALALCSAVAPDWAAHGVFLNLWHGFMAGACAYWAAVRRGSPVPLLILCAAMVFGATLTERVFEVPAAVTALGLYVARNRLSERLPSVLMALGTISYSLYLVHVPVIHVSQAAGLRIGLPSWMAALGAIIAAICSAMVLYFMIERPSHQLAQRLFAKR